MAYVTFDEMQQLLIEHIQQGGQPLDYPEACQKAIELGLPHEEEPVFDHDFLIQQLSDANFEQLLHQYPLGIIGKPPVWHNSLPWPNEIFALHHLYNPDSVPHAPKRFRVFYAYKGDFDMMFEHQRTHLKCGDVAFVAPSCSAIAYMPKGNIVLQLSVLTPCFESVFNSLISQSNVIGTFLRSVLYSSNRINYLLFHTENDETLKGFFKSMFVQQLYPDTYTIPGLRYTLGSLMTHLMRFYSTNASYFRTNQQISITTVLNYLQNNWRTLTLNKLATTFGYNPSYLSSAIRQETGMTFTHLITQLRMSEAVRQLQAEDAKIADVAYTVGYQSPEHFSRSFRAYFGQSPDEFRKNRST